MVVLKLVVWLILERDYSLNGENATGRKFLEIIKDPENTLVGQFVNHFKQRYWKEHREDLEIKYIKEAQDDADIDPEYSIADVFIDYGKAQRDSSDQRASVKLIRKTVEGIALRAGSVVPDLNLPQFQAPISRKPPIPRPEWGSAAPVLGKRTSEAAFGAHHPPLPQGEALHRIAEEDRPVSSIEREERPVSLEIPESQPNAHMESVTKPQQPPPNSDEEPKSESDEESHIPSTYTAIQPTDAAVTGSLPAADPVGVLSRAGSSRGDEARQTSTSRQLLDIGSPASTSHGFTEAPVSSHILQPSSHPPVQVVPPSRFLTSEGRLPRPRRSFNSPAAFAKPVSHQQGKRRTNTYDVPESDIEDSQQEPARPITKRRKVSKRLSSSPSGSHTQSTRGHPDHVLVGAGIHHPYNPVSTSAEVTETRDTANGQPQSDGDYVMEDQQSEGQDANDPKKSSALQPVETRSVNVASDAVESGSTSSRSTPSSRHADSDKENSQPSSTGIHRIIPIAVLGPNNDSPTANMNDAPGADLNGPRTPTRTIYSHPPSTQKELAALSVLQDVKDAKSGSKVRGSSAGAIRAESSAAKSPKVPDLGVSQVDRQQAEQKAIALAQNPQSETIEITDGEPERQLGLGITQSPGRRRRTSSFMEEPEATNGKPSPSVSSTRPIPKGKKGKQSVKEPTPSAEKPRDAASLQLEKKPRSRKSLFGNGKSKMSPPIGDLASVATDVQIEGGRKEDASHSKTLKDPSPETARKAANMTSTGQILPPGMTEEEYNRLKGNYKPAEFIQQKKNRTKSSIEKSSTKDSTSADRITHSLIDDRSPAVDEDAGTTEGDTKNAVDGNPKEITNGPVATEPRKSKSSKKKSDGTGEGHDRDTNSPTISKQGSEIAQTPKPRKTGAKSRESLLQAGDGNNESATKKKSRKTKESHIGPTSFATPNPPGDVAVVIAQRSSSPKLTKKSTPIPSTLEKKVSTAKPQVPSGTAKNSRSLTSADKAPTVAKVNTKSIRPAASATSTTLTSPKSSTPKTLTPGLASLKQKQAAERQARAEREKQARKQAAAQKAAAKAPAKAFSLEDDDDESSSDDESESEPEKARKDEGKSTAAGGVSAIKSTGKGENSQEKEDSSEDLATELALPMKRKYSLTPERGSLTPGKRQEKTTRASETPAGRRKANVSFTSPGVKNKEPAIASANDSDSDETSSSGSSDPTSASASTHPLQANGSAIPRATRPTSQTTKPKQAREDDDSSDDTDIVKEDETPPRSQQTAAAPSSSAKTVPLSSAPSNTSASRWGFSRLNVFGRS